MEFKQSVSPGEPGEGLSRREFVKSAVAAGVVLSTASSAWTAEPTGGMPLRDLGRTGQKVSAIGLGGYHIGIPPEEVGIRIIRSAIDRGITFMDNCWDYHDGGSEIRMGKALRDGYREKVFLMSKIDGRTKSAAKKQIEESLQRLQTDHIDLMQFHEILRMEDPDRIFAERGGMEAMLEAKKEGKVRFIGFTGHKDPLVHLRMLEIAAQHQFHFDAVQMPLNLMDAHFRSFGQKVLPELTRQGIGVLGMKPIASGHILQSHTVSALECLQYALSLPASVVITGIDKLELLDQAFEAARTFPSLGKQQLASLLDRTREAARAGHFEPFKTTANYDGTARRPEWLG
jgi:predicted aldo/keto reductase-like oxidoreductase